MLTQKQRLIINFCHSNNGRITKQQALDMPAVNTYYCNGSKHVGDVLSRMVKQNILIREKPGHFILSTGTRKKPSDQPENQAKLF